MLNIQFPAPLSNLRQTIENNNWLHHLILLNYLS